jgi:hypothetical protein
MEAVTHTDICKGVDGDAAAAATEGATMGAAGKGAAAITSPDERALTVSFKQSYLKYIF